ncbi:MAG: undecaprenyl-phosphate glucose phosphotransferase [Bacteroidota bacterium]
MRHRRYSRYFPLFFLAFDLVCLNVSFTLGCYIKFGRHLYNDENYLGLQLVLNFLWLLIFFSGRLYDLSRDLTLGEQINRVLTALILNVGVVLAIWFVSKPFYFSRQQVFFTYLFFCASTIGWRIAWYYLIRYYRRRGFNVRHVVMVGYERMADQMIQFMGSNPGMGYKLVAVFDDNDSGARHYRGKIADLEGYVAENNVDILFCNINSLAKNRLQQLINFADSNLIKVKILSQFSDLELRNLTIQNYGAIPVLNVNEIPLDNSVNQFTKRAFDILFSLAVITFVLSWLMPILALLIKLESRGPVFFKQKRHGKENRLFTCLKFRTMVINAEADHRQASKADDRITRIGSFLRQTSIDELPQFLNVLLGDMSIVGPRPHPIKLNEQYQPTIEKFWQRHAVKPGITGLAQAKGFRGETDFAAMNGRVKLDRFYVKNWSLILDMKIIFLTIVSLMRGSENAY